MKKSICDSDTRHRRLPERGRHATPTASDIIIQQPVSSRAFPNSRHPRAVLASYQWLLVTSNEFHIVDVSSSSAGHCLAQCASSSVAKVDDYGMAIPESPACNHDCLTERLLLLSRNRVYTLAAVRPVTFHSKTNRLSIHEPA